MDIKKLLQSLKFAGEGIIAVFKSEQNFRIEIFAAVVVICLMIILKVTFLEVILLSMLIVNVLAMEILNTVLEYLLDMQTTRKRKKFKFMKDAMAGAVLLNVIVAVIAGMIIFGRYFL